MSGEGEILWAPPSDSWETSRIGRFASWLRERHGLAIDDYESLWRWSTEDLSGFWSALWDYMGVAPSHGYRDILSWTDVNDARWFDGATLNYAEHLLHQAPAGDAIVGLSQSRPRICWSGAELADQVARCRAGMVRLGVGKGDRVAAILPNIPEAIAAFLATASLGAIWTSCPPEFGTRSIIDRFRQVEPKLLLTVDGYRYGNKDIAIGDRIRDVTSALPGLSETIVLDYLGTGISQMAQAQAWTVFTAGTAPIAFEQVAFDHPLYILYSSGTTGLPKPIVHGHGGILIEHFKNIALHLDVGPGDRFFWFSTTGWMMWNLLVSGLLTGATIVTFDGNPSWPDNGFLWRLADEERLTFLGVSASFLTNCQAGGIDPGLIGAYPALRGVGSTGSPLPPGTARWLYEVLPATVHLGSGSGGTDICSAFVGAVPVKPVYANAMTCRYLAAKVEAFDEAGNSLIGSMGELVITRPMPSMPVAFWNDAGGQRYRAAYFDVYPGIWRHGDWITIHDNGTCTIHGRSDATLNRGGVRLGTAEFYALVEAMPDVADSLVVHVDDGSGHGIGELVLFLVLRDPESASDDMIARIKALIREQLSPRHVPDSLYFVPAVPRTLSAKKLEVPVKQMLLGVPAKNVISAGSLADPRALDALNAIVLARGTYAIDKELQA